MEMTHTMKLQLLLRSLSTRRSRRMENKEIIEFFSSEENEITITANAFHYSKTFETTTAAAAAFYRVRAKYSTPLFSAAASVVCITKYERKQREENSFFFV
jgi:hypothetical protein